MIFRIAMALCCLLPFWCALYAGQPRELLAAVTMASGDAHVIHGQKDVVLKANRLLYRGDHIYTRNGKAQIQLGKGAIIFVAPNSYLKLDDIGDKGDGQEVQLALETGQTFVKITDKLGPNSRFRVRTQNLVAGVRGTEFAVSEISAAPADANELVKAIQQNRDKRDELPTGVFVNEGSVELSDQKHPGTENLTVEKDQQAVAVDNGFRKGRLSAAYRRRMRLFSGMNTIAEDRFEKLNLRKQMRIEGRGGGHDRGMRMERMQGRQGNQRDDRRGGQEMKQQMQRAKGQ